MIGPSLLVLQLNEQKEIVSYKQRHLNKVVRQAQDVTLLSASESVIQLSEQGSIPGFKTDDESKARLLLSRDGRNEVGADLTADMADRTERRRTVFRQRNRRRSPDHRTA